MLTIPYQFGGRVRAVASASAIAAAALAVAACNTDRVFSSDGAPAASVDMRDYYSVKELAYFDDIATAADKPDSIRRYLDTVVHKWRTDIRIGVTGAARASDTAFARTVCAELTAAIGGPVRVSLDTDGTRNLELHLSPPDSLYEQVRAGWASGENNLPIAYSATTVDAAGYVLSAASVLDGAIEGYLRDRVMRHELMHAIGFGHHSHREPGALLYDTYTEFPSTYQPVDLGAIEMLYRDEITAGMTNGQAEHTLGPLRRRKAP